MPTLSSIRARDIALAVAREAAVVVREGWGNVHEIRSKTTDLDLVTEWDTRVEALIVERLRALAPHVKVLGEEEGEHAAAAGSAHERWLVDPIDGTVNFVHGLPLFAVSIAYEADGVVWAGATIAPALGWEFCAARGAGATLNGEPVRVSAQPELARALLATGFPYDRAVSPDNNFREFFHLQRTAGAVRRLGAASLDLCFVACGWLDGYWEHKLKPWDLAAGVVLVEEAGGRVTGMRGGPLSLEAGHVAASNGKIHDDLLRELAVAAGLPPL